MKTFVCLFICIVFLCVFTSCPQTACDQMEVTKVYENVVVQRIEIEHGDVYLITDKGVFLVGSMVVRCELKEGKVYDIKISGEWRGVNFIKELREAF